jgi:hypothetical protein
MQEIVCNRRNHSNLRRSAVAFMRLDAHVRLVVFHLRRTSVSRAHRLEQRGILAQTEPLPGQLLRLVNCEAPAMIVDRRSCFGLAIAKS